MNILVLQLGSAALYGLAGFFLYVGLSNRFFIFRPHSKARTMIMLACLLAFSGGAALAGYFAWHPPWVFVPAAFLLLVLAGEARNLRLRRACAASGPLDSTPHRVAVSAPITTTDLTVHRYAMASPKWAGRPLRVVQITDLHVNETLPLDYYLDALKTAEQAQPDLAVFTGDFITRAAALPKLKRILRPVARFGNLAVLGNHDYWADPGAVRTALRECGLHPLTNETIALEVEGRRLAVSGDDHPWRPVASGAPARHDGLLHLVLSHTPDNIYRIARASADAAFCGHFHAGQIRLPLLGAIIVPSAYGRRFDHGHFLVHGTHLFVASGIGAVTPSIRVYCQPDIFVVDILPETRY